ncbi:MAG: tyrosine-type recombinase/integrase, partial [Pseudomonadales bacterium]
MRRYLNQIRPVFETARVELEISMPNPLARLKIPLDNDDPDNDRGSFTVEQIRAIQKRCREINDQRRWCIAILSDTGARLSEIAGLKKEDVRIEGQYPHLSITRNDVRGLKPGGSERLIPLVGEALWAAQQAFKDNSTAYLFPD